MVGWISRIFRSSSPVRLYPAYPGCHIVKSLDPSIYEALQKEGVVVGDVVYIEANSGAVKRVGRSDAFATVSTSAWHKILIYKA